jgi:uncharacterized metal-binding protein YceD (DUF177 family)
MKVKLHEIAASQDGVEASFSRDRVWLAEVIEPPGGELSRGVFELAATLQLMNEDEILVRGKGHAELAVPCARCLEEVPVEVSFPFDLLFLPQSKQPKVASKNTEIELKADDLDVDFYKGEELDLDEVAREQLLLALPANSVCSESCQGLCPRCGHNRNEGACSCAPEEIVDPRLAKLAKFMPSGESKG